MTTSPSTPDIASLQREQGLLKARLARVRRRLVLESVLEFVVDAAVVLTGGAAILVLLDWWFRLGTTVRLVFLVVSSLAIVTYLAIRAIQRWQDARLDDIGLALVLDRFRPGTGQHVADVLQLPGLLAEPSFSASPAMVELAVRQATEALKTSDWHQLWNKQRTARHIGVLVGCVFLPIAFALLAPDAARLSLDRWLRGSSERWPQRTYLTIVGLGDRDRLIAPKDEAFTIEVRSDLFSVHVNNRGTQFLAGRGEPLVVRREPRSSKAPREVLLRERIPGQGHRSTNMVVTAPGRYRFEFPPASDSSTFELFGSDDWLGPVPLERRDRPAIEKLALRVREPGANYEGFRTVEDTRQHLLFLPDTTVDLTLVGNTQIGDFHVEAHPKTVPGLKRLDGRTFSSRWTLREPATLEIQITSFETGLSSKPAYLSLGLLRDREPRVSLRASGVSSRVTPIATIPLDVAATDDLGLAALRIQVDRTAPPKDEKEAPQPPKRQTIAIPLAATEGRPVLDRQARHDVDLQADPPETGSILKFVGEADDHCARGAQTGRSSALQIQVVPPEELFYELLIRQRAERAKFLTALEAVEKQGPNLAGSPARDSYVNVMRVLQTNTRQIDQIANRIADTLQEMKLNQIGSPKSHRLLQEGIIDPIRSLESGPLTELRGMLQSLAGGTPKAGANGDTARKLHGEVVTKMRNILEQMSQWESFVDVVNQVAELIKMQQKILQATEKARQSRTQEVFDEKP